MGGKGFLLQETTSAKELQGNHTPNTKTSSEVNILEQRDQGEAEIVDEVREEWALEHGGSCGHLILLTFILNEMESHVRILS